MARQHTSLPDGLLLVAVIIGWAVLDWLGSENITMDEIVQEVRLQGMTSLTEVELVALEGDGLEHHPEGPAWPPSGQGSGLSGRHCGKTRNADGFQGSDRGRRPVADVAGVATVVIGALVSIPLAFGWRRDDRLTLYRSYRQLLGRSILLGLELLVAADIIRTVAVTPTLQSVAVLAVIVVIWTFLSFSLELEITGRWPWQKERQPS